MTANVAALPLVATLPLAEIEEALYGLYQATALPEKMRETRAALARRYHDLTGRWFAARFYY